MPQCINHQNVHVQPTSSWHLPDTCIASPRVRCYLCTYWIFLGQVEKKKAFTCRMFQENIFIKEVPGSQQIGILKGTHSSHFFNSTFQPTWPALQTSARMGIASKGDILSQSEFLKGKKSVMFLPSFCFCFSPQTFRSLCWGTWF